MTVNIVKYAFIAGEISDTLYGRTDLTKFDLGMAEARNFFVDYRGGLSSRPGTQFMEYVKTDDKDTRMVPFAFSPDIEDNNLLLFGDLYVRILQSGNYVLEAATACTTSSATPLVVTAAGHGLTAGRWIKVAGVSYEVGSTTTNTFELLNVPDGSNVDGSSVSFTSYQAVYEVVTPYLAADLDDLHFDQYRDRVRICGTGYAIRDLTRSGATSWALSTVDISPSYTGPNVTSETLSDTGTAQTIFAITKVLADGTESVEGDPYRLDGAVNYPTTEGSVSILWAADSEARYYNVYRSIVAGGTTAQVLSLGSELGYVGQTTGTKFTDANIIPDFGRKPPRNYNPFAPGAIETITVTAGGTGYTSVPTVSFGGGGSGAIARAVINDSGAVVNIVLLNGGSGYSSPTVSFSGGGGSGATATATARASSGTYPSRSVIFQQRQVFAASLERPITIWGSQSGRFDNFNSSDLVLATDSYEFDLDTAAINPIKHIFAARGGLLAMTQENVWLVRGETDKVVTPTSVLADPQTYTGVSTLEPIRIGATILYTEGIGYAVRTLQYNEVSRVYSGVDRSILSSHLFGKGKEIISWAYQESPYKVVWCVRADGALLAFTYVEEEEVFAWTPCDTQGLFTDVAESREGNENIITVTVRRYISGRWTKFIERLDLRNFTYVEDSWAVDCGLNLAPTYPTGTVQVNRSGENYTAVISAGGSWVGQEGKVLRVAGGVFVIASVSGSTATLTKRKHPDTWIAETDETLAPPQTTGNWTLDSEVTTISGLDHLEGETVSILADGVVVPRKVVANGQITLTVAASRVVVGLRFSCRAKTLPLIVPDAGIEGKRKRVVAVLSRVRNSRALKAGDSYETVYEHPERTNEPYGQPTELQSDLRRQTVGTFWDEEAFTYFLLDDPLPATLLSMVQETEVGDEDD